MTCSYWLFLLLLHLILLISQLPTSQSSPSSDLFNTWCKDYKKSYTSEQEKEQRLKIFEKNYEYVTQHNSKPNNSYKLSLNAFADLTNQEFKAKYLGLSASENDLLIRMKSGQNFVEEFDIPSSVDWRAKGAVTGVKDQGSCGM